MTRRGIAIWGLLALAFFLILLAMPDAEPLGSPADLLVDVQRGTVDSLEFGPEDVAITRTDGSTYRVAGAVDPGVLELLAEQGVPMTVADTSSDYDLLWILLGILVVVGGIVWWLRRSAATQTASITQLAKSRARLVANENVETRFDHVGGATEAKARLRDVIDYLKSPERWEQAGVKAPRGVLLEGPPGCGKTLLARAVAGEAGVPFFTVAGSEMVEMFVGVGAARVRSLFEEAAKVAPAVIFIDEIDAVGRRRGTQTFAGFAEWEQTLNQLLVSMDGFENRGRLVVIGATNRADILDPALLRPGRFDIRLKLGELSAADRLQILGIHARGKPAQDVDLTAVAGIAHGLSGAQLELLVNEAAMHAFRRGSPLVEQDFHEARATLRRQEPDMDALDEVLQEAHVRRIEPTEPLWLQVTLIGGTELRGRLLWADPKLLKLEVDGTRRLIPKEQLVQLESVDA